MSFGGLSGVLLMVRRSLRQHALSTAVTAGAMALGCGLVMSVYAIQEQTRSAFTAGATGFDAVLGARGSQLQLVLNTVFHLETSPGNLPYSMYKDIAANPMVELAIPYAVGDNYKGYRIVGTTPEQFTEVEYGGEKGARFAAGRVFSPTAMEAVIGSFAARKLGLTVGSKFQPYHGVIYNEKAQHAEVYVVVGVLEPTNTPADRVIWIPIDGIYYMAGHTLRGTGEDYQAQKGRAIPDEAKEVSAVMLKLRGPMAGMSLSGMINNQGKVATLAWPIATVMADLFNKLGWMHGVLELVALLVVVVAAGAMLAAVYNTMNERRREMAIMRALGARRQTLFSAILLESAAIGGLGGLAGFVVYAAILGVAAAIIREQTGVVVDIWSLHPALWATPLGAVAVGAASGLAPAVKAYRTDVAENLLPLS